MAKGTTTNTSDVVVIGGGLIGCTIALRLAQAKQRVCVLDRGQPGAEASTAAAGMLAPQGEAVDLDAFYEFCAASRDLYPEFIREIQELSSERIDYHRDGTLVVGIEEHECQELERIYAAQSRLGLSTELLKPEEAHARVKGLSPEIQRALYIGGDHRVDNERLTHAVIKACRQLGVTICAGRPVRKLNLRGDRVESVDAEIGRAHV